MHQGWGARERNCLFCKRLTTFGGELLRGTETDPNGIAEARQAVVAAARDLDMRALAADKAILAISFPSCRCVVLKGGLPLGAI